MLNPHQNESESSLYEQLKDSVEILESGQEIKRRQPLVFVVGLSRLQVTIVAHRGPHGDLTEALQQLSETLPQLETMLGENS